MNFPIFDRFKFFILSHIFKNYSQPFNKENILDGFGSSDQFINQMLSSSAPSELPDLGAELPDLGMETDLKPNINPLNSSGSNNNNNRKGEYFIFDKNKI